MIIHGVWLIGIPFLSTPHYIDNSSPCMCEGRMKIFLSLKRENAIVCTDVCSPNNCERMCQSWITMTVLVAPSLDIFTALSHWQCGFPKPLAHLFFLFTGPAAISSPKGCFTALWQSVPPLLLAPLHTLNFRCPSLLLGRSNIFISLSIQTMFFPFPSRLNSLPHRWLFFPLQRSSRRWFHNQFDHWWALECCPDSLADETWDK